MKRRSDARDSILKAAGDLFYRDGIHATGVDTVVEHSGVAKMTLYKHFPSKDDLIVAWLMVRCENWRAWFREEIERQGKTPKGKLLAVFDALHSWFTSKDFHGCAFVNASAEFSKPEHRIHQTAKAHKQVVLDYLTSLAQDTSARNPRELAEQISLLMEGAISSALVHDDPECAKSARTAAAALLAAHGVE